MDELNKSVLIVADLKKTIHIDETIQHLLLSDPIKETFTLQLVEQTHVDEARHHRFVFAECRDEIAPPGNFGARDAGETVGVKLSGFFQRSRIGDASVTRQRAIGGGGITFDAADGFYVPLEESFQQRPLFLQRAARDDNGSVGQIGIGAQVCEGRKAWR